MLNVSLNALVLSQIDEDHNKLYATAHTCSSGSTLIKTSSRRSVKSMEADLAVIMMPHIKQQPEALGVL